MEIKALLMDRTFPKLFPVIAGEEICSPYHSYGPSVRRYYLIHYIFEGCGKIETSDGIFAVKKGEMFIIRPDEVTYYEADGENPWHYAWIGFRTDTELPVFSENRIIASEKSRRIFSDIADCCKSGDNDTEMYLYGKLYELLSVLSKRTSGGVRKSNEYVLKAKNYIDNNFSYDINVLEIADELGLDRSYFSTLFKKYTGLSPKQYIVEVRLDHAARLMKENGISPSEAAFRCGYKDIFNFSKMFKRRFGTAPSYYSSPQD